VATLLPADRRLEADPVVRLSCTNYYVIASNWRAISTYLDDVEIRVLRWLRWLRVSKLRLTSWCLRPSLLLLLLLILSAAS
jgi:hypothetical protein